MGAGFALYALDPLWLREPLVMALATLLFGALLWAADVKAAQGKRVETMRWRDALMVGCAQILALIPGTSRSGITMTAARFLGYTRVEAARYSLLLAVVAISGAGTLGSVDVLDMQGLPYGFARDVLLATGLSFVSALGAIALMMRWLATQSFAVFAVYRIALGIVLLAMIALGWL